MAKEASALTQAIRSLCDETGGDITHAESRPRLKKMGFDVVPDPGRRSANLRALDEYDGIDFSARDIVGTIEATLGVDNATAKKIASEGRRHDAFKAERNNFDVTKYNWKKARESGKASPSRKPTNANSKSRVAASSTASRPPAKHAKNRTATATTTPVATGDLAALEYVEQAGGLSAVEQQLADAQAQVEAAQAEVDRLQGIVDAVQAHVARVEKVAA